MTSRRPHTPEGSGTGERAQPPSLVNADPWQEFLSSGLISR